MLKGISPLINPELLQILSEMGHGDEIVIGDGNFPRAPWDSAACGATAWRAAAAGCDFAAVSAGRFRGRAGDADGGGARQRPDGEPPIWQTFREIIARHEPTAKIGFCERFAFYERSRRAFATIQTGEGALYACVILKKGVIRQ